MPRQYTSKDTHDLLKSVKTELKKLNAVKTLPPIWAGKIKSKVLDLYQKKFFLKLLDSELLDGKAKPTNDVHLLTVYLYALRQLSAQKDRAEALLASDEDRLLRLVKDASKGASGLSWFLSSKKKKDAAEDAYVALHDEIENGLFWTDAEDVLSRVEAAQNAHVDVARADFLASSEVYRQNLKSILPKNLFNAYELQAFTLLNNNYTRIRDGINPARKTVDGLREDIKTAANLEITAQVMDVLRQVPVEELNRDKRGIRTKALRDARFDTVASVVAASRSQISSVYGISEDAAYTIKNVAQGFAAEAKKTAKIKLSADRQTKNTTALVIGINKYIKCVDLVKRLDALKTDFEEPIEKALTAVSFVKTGVLWPFYTDAQKQAVRDAYLYLKSTVSGDYKDTVLSIRNGFGGIKNVTSTEAWADFVARPVTYTNVLEELVPELLGNDDRLYGLPEDLAREIDEECFFPDGLTCDLRRYQEWGVKYILHQKRVLLGDEMGLGKTVQAIAAMVSLRNTGARHFMVVCPASVLQNWFREIRDKSKLSATVIHGAGKSYALASWLRSGGVAVTTYETTGSLKLDDTFKIDCLVVDEAHFVKNENAARSKHVRALCDRAKRVLFMTGTALENKVDEMISLIRVLQPDVASRVQHIAFMSSAPEFRRQIAPVYYRRKREDVLTELPDLIESKEWCTLSGDEASLYRQNVLSKNMMSIRRLSWDVADLKDSCKARRMMEIIEDATEDGRKVLVFSFFIETLRKVHDFLGTRATNPINGSISPQRRQEIIDEFHNAPAGTVLCAQIQAGGTGLNIQDASVVIICEPQLKPSIENQAISRAYRMGQGRNVLVYRLLCEGTVDERITEMLSQKQAQFDAFADKSVAAKATADKEKELDETTLSRIIEDEIERIKNEEK